MPTSGSIGGPQYGSSQFSNEYSRNPNTIGGPPFPLQLNQRGYMPNTGYPVQQTAQQRSGDKLQQVHSQQQQQQQQPLYQQYPPPSVGYLAGDVYNPQHQEYVQMNQLPNQHYNLQQRQQAQGQQLKLQLNEQNAMMSASTQQYPVRILQILTPMHRIPQNNSNSNNLFEPSHNNGTATNLNLCILLLVILYHPQSSSKYHHRICLHQSSNKSSNNSHCRQNKEQRKTW